MKLNEEDFSFGIAIIHFRDNPYQEINFQNHLSIVPLCK